MAGGTAKKGLVFLSVSFSSCSFLRSARSLATSGCVETTVVVGDVVVIMFSRCGCDGKGAVEDRTN